MSKYFFVCIPVFFLVACANMKSISIENDNYKSEGFIYYEPEPYLLVHETRSEKSGTITSSVNVSVVYFPNKNLRRSLVMTGGFGSVSFKPTFENGWNLTGIDVTTDSQIDEAISAVASVIEARTAGAVTVDGNKVFSPGLYRIKYDGGFIGGFERINIPAMPTTTPPSR